MLRASLVLAVALASAAPVSNVLSPDDPVLDSLAGDDTVLDGRVALLNSRRLKAACNSAQYARNKFDKGKIKQKDVVRKCNKCQKLCGYRNPSAGMSDKQIQACKIHADYCSTDSNGKFLDVPKEEAPSGPSAPAPSNAPKEEASSPSAPAPSTTPTLEKKKKEETTSRRVGKTCPENEDFDSSGNCKCNEGFEPNRAKGGICEKKKKEETTSRRVGKTCPENEDFDLRGNCQCNEGFERNRDKRDGPCQEKKEKKVPLVHTYDCPEENEVVFPDGTCDCKRGTRRNGDGVCKPFS